MGLQVSKTPHSKAQRALGLRPNGRHPVWSLASFSGSCGFQHRSCLGASGNLKAEALAPGDPQKQ